MRYGLFTPEHDALRDSVRSFVAKELRPNADDWEQASEFPRETFARAGELGLFGMNFPPDVGGSGPDPVAAAVVIEELTLCGSGGVAASLGAHKDLACLYLFNLGSSEQHGRWLTPALAGEIIGALGVTEPDAGSDVASLRTTARRDGDGWIINGSKMFITNGAWADFVVVAAKTDPDAGHEGITLFVVESDAPGYEARRIPTLGWRTSKTGAISLADVRVHDDCRIGEEGSGFAAIMRNFAWERVAMALAQVASAQHSYEVARTYAQDRHTFGRPVAKFQAWRHRFADMATRIEASRALTYHALRRFKTDDNPIRESAMAKLHSSELAFHVADECMQIHGGYGYMTEFPAERVWRDARLGPIGGGTSEIMRELIGRSYGL
jgi:acyl-CoA dehydrogenase